MSELFTPYIQAGFAGLCFVLVGVICWLMRQVIDVLRATSQVIERNTSAIDRLNTSTHRVERAVNEMRDELLKRPCIASEKDA